MHKTLHPRVDIDKFYVRIKEGRGELENIQDFEDEQYKGLKNNKARLITAHCNSNNKGKTMKKWKKRKEKKQISTLSDKIRSLNRRWRGCCYQEETQSYKLNLF